MDSQFGERLTTMAKTRTVRKFCLGADAACIGAHLPLNPAQPDSCVCQRTDFMAAGQLALLQSILAASLLPVGPVTVQVMPTLS